MFVCRGPEPLGVDFYNTFGGDFYRTFDGYIDRSKVHHDLMICETIPEMAPCKSFETCMKEQAHYIKELVNEHSLNPYLMFSGGIDSTGVLYALINAGLEFNVVFNQGSINENPKVAQDLLDKKFRGVNPILCNNGEVTFPEHPKANPDAFYITGEIGDQTFGSEGMYKFDYDTRQLPVEEAVDKGLVPRELFNVTIDSVNKIIPDKLTLSEYLWAANFIFKYQDVLLRCGAVGLSSYGPKQNAIHFYNSTNFQLYSMNSYRENSNFVRQADYKMPLKEYIYKNNSDKYYLENKIKEGSFHRGAYVDFLNKCSSDGNWHTYLIQNQVFLGSTPRGSTKKL